MGAVCVGALDLYRDRSGELSYDEHADALIMAEVVAQSVVTMQAQAPSGTLHAELTSGDTAKALCTRPPEWFRLSSE